MASTETEWTANLPTLNGVYWYRLDAKARPDIVQIHDKDVYYTGDGIGLSLVNHTGGEFLGPLSPSDAQQLIELRKLIEKALNLKWIRDLRLNHRDGCAAITLHDRLCSCGLKDYLAIDDEMRAVLEPEAKETKS